MWGRPRVDTADSISGCCCKEVSTMLSEQGAEEVYSWHAQRRENEDSRKYCFIQTREVLKISC